MRLLLMCLILLAAPLRPVLAQDAAEGTSPIVLTFDMTGGQRPRVDGPILTIAADGTVTARPWIPGDPPVRAVLPETEFDALMTQIVTDLGALDITTAAIEAEVAAAGVRPSQTADASTTSLILDLPEGRADVTVRAVSALAAQVPDAPTLLRLLVIQRRLMDLARSLTAP